MIPHALIGGDQLSSGRKLSAISFQASAFQRLIADC